MPDRENVNVRIKFNAVTGQLDRALAKMKALQQFERRFSSDQMMASLSKGNMKWKKSFDFVDKAIKGTGFLLSKFLMTAIKGVVLEMAALSAAMLATHALFAAGRFLVKAYHGAMQVLAGGAAAAAVAIGTVAAAIREQQAAMYAYRGKGLAGFGAGINQVQVAMRALHADAGLAGLGVEALNKAFATMSKSMSSSQIAGSQKQLKMLMDFGAAGQDPAKGVEQAAAVVAALNDQKKSIGEVVSAARGLGPEMQKALKDANIKTKAQFKEMLFSGELAEKGGVTGQFEAVNNTLIGQLKTYMTLVRTEFADFGMQFLEPAKVAFQRLVDVIRVDLQRISAAIQGSFGAQGMIDAMVNGIIKISNWFVKTIREYLPRAQGMFERIGDWLRRFRNGWNAMLDKLRPMIDGAKVIEKAFERIWYAIKRGASNMGLFRELLVKNEGTVVEFGERMAGFIDSGSKLFTNMKKVFFDVLPVINDVLSGVKMIFDFLTKILSSGGGSGLLKSLAPLIAFQVIGKKMSGVTGRLSPVQTKAPNMNVQAQVVNVNTPGGRGGMPINPGAAPYLSSGGGPAMMAGLGAGYRPYTSQLPAYLPMVNYANRPQANPDFGGRYGTATPFASSMQGTEMMGSMRMRTRNDTGLFSHDFYDPARYYQHGQGLGQRITFEGPMRMRDAIRAGADLKSEFTVGGEHAAGLNARHYERTVMHQGGGVAGAATPIGPIGRGAYGGIESAVDYSRLSEKKLAALAGARGVAASVDALREQDRDRYIASQVAAGRMSWRDATGAGGFSGTFRESELPRWMAAGGGTPGVIADPGLLESEAKGRARLDRQTFRDDRRAARRQSFRRAVGGAQGLMAFLNKGRYDPTMAGGEVPVLDRAGNPVMGEDGQPLMRQQMGGQVNAAALREEARQQNLNRAKQTGSGRAMTRFRNMRDIARINRTQTTFGAGMNKFAGSAGGRMGTSMGLSMMSQYAPEEMRGAMALGGMASMIDPRLGLAVAGIGGALKAKSAGAGALAGAMGGAQIGQMFGPWGAAIGAGIGLLAGGIMGAINGHKEKMKKATKAAQSMLNSMFTGIAETASIKMRRNNELIEGGAKLTGQRGAFQDIASTFITKRKGFAADMKAAIGTGGTERERGLAAIDFVKKYGKKYGMEPAESLIKDMEGSPEKAMAKFMESGSEFDKTMLGIETVNNKRIDELTRATGKSAPELEKLASELGINLYDATVKYSDMVKKLGASMVKTAGQLKNAMVDIVLNAGNIFKKRREAREAQLAIDQSSAALYSTLSSGDLTGDERTQAVEKYFEDYGAQTLAMYGGDPKKAFFAMQDAFGTEGQGLFAKGAQFEGMEGDLFDPARQLREEMKKGVVTLYADQLANMATAEGLSMDKGALEKGLGGLTNDKLMVLTNLLDRGAISFKDNAGKVKSIGDITKQLEAYGLTGTGLREVPETELDKYVMSADKFDKSSEAFKEAVEVYKTATSQFFGGSDSAPDWWKKGLVFDGKTLSPPPDTATPRGGAIGDTTSSRLAQTMARHQAMNSQLTGTRTVTSSWRDWNLGSINSDHVTGRAYDLTGQNLGAYQQLVKRGGGFAEFHGTMKNRHLHVVPGKGSAIVGDSSSAAPQPAISSGVMAGGSTIYNTFNISTNDPQAAAREVMRMLNEQERSSRERA